MKKSIFILSLAVLAITGLSSCKKCVECTARDYSTGNVVDTDEKCGNKAVTSTWKTDYELTWLLYDVSCTDK
jgi:hypothetical protein